jgi:hydrogenase expression/formation protein HypD
LAIRPAYAAYDATRVFDVRFGAAHLNPACRCGDVLRGLCTPLECKLFGRGCNPTHPVGPCMVSSEGACAAYYKYEARVAA